MINYKTLILSTVILVAISLKQRAFAQLPKSQQELDNFLLEIKKSKIDTFLVVKSGCIGCEVNEPKTSKVIEDAKTFYVLTQKKGRIELAIFDDFNPQKHQTIDTCSIFEFAFSNQSTLLEKDIFYKKEIPKIKSKNGFFPPIPVHHSYYELNIHSPKFIYEFSILNNNKDNFGVERKQEWFVLTKEIIKRVENQLKRVKN